MKKIITIIFCLTISCSFSQTKKELIDSIISVNRVDSDCVGYGCIVSDQYKRFQRLKKKLSNQELLDLSKHENPILRTYVLNEIVQTGKGNIPHLFALELSKNQKATRFVGCIISSDPISSIIYHEYWNKIRIEAAKKTTGNNYMQDLAAKKKLQTDIIMEKLDSIVIHSNEDVYFLLYNRTFENRKHKDSFLPKIEELAFEKNNSFAFKYLKKYYSSKYQKRFEKYFTVDFQKAQFLGENTYHLRYFIEALLEMKTERFTQIVVDKFKDKNSWDKNSYWFEKILEEHGVKTTKN